MIQGQAKTENNITFYCFENYLTGFIWQQKDKPIAIDNKGEPILVNMNILYHITVYSIFLDEITDPHSLQ